VRPRACFSLRRAQKRGLPNKLCLADHACLPHAGLHVLVNNSGNNWGAPFDEYPDSAWGQSRRLVCFLAALTSNVVATRAERVLTLNLRRVFTLTQKLTPLMLKSLGGKEEGPWADPGEPRLLSSPSRSRTNPSAFQPA
jgi:NAD(P)-dependent dehydrogenase (short-subunit alcohol dehydrogenase family)